MLQQKLRSVITLVALVCAVSIAAPAGAQTADASLRGYVRDQQGLVLPGVTMTANSPALLAPVVAVTDSEGFYRLLNLPSGDYVVTAELPGFSTFSREGIFMRSGGTFTVDIEMALGTLQETIIVSGESPMIETSAPASIINIEGELARVAPMTSKRLFTDIIEMVPGARTRNVTGGWPGRAVYFHGAHLYAHAYQLEGAPASSFWDSSSHSMNMGGDLMQDVQLITGGADASTPLTTGVVMNVTTPQGGNQLSGAATYTFQPLGWNADNTHKGRNTGGLPTIQGTKQWDLTLGGPIVRDKVWFFTTYRYSDHVNGISRSAEALRRVLSFRPDFVPFDATYKSHQPYVKLTAQLGDGHQLAGFYQSDKNKVRKGTQDMADGVDRIAMGGGLMQAKATSVWNNQLMSTFSVAYSTKSGMDKETYESGFGSGPKVNIHEDTFLSGGFPEGDGVLVQMDNLESVAYRPASMLILRGDITYFKERMGGSHEFKVGYWAAPRLTVDWNTRYLNNGFVLEERRQIDPNNPAAGVIPFHRRYRSPAEVLTISARERDIGLYVQDSWRPTSRLTVNMGVRVDYIKRQDQIFDFTRMDSVNMGPRFGMSYLLTEDARTVLRASYGLIHEQVNGRDYPTRFNSALPRNAELRDTYDADGDGIFEGEQVSSAATAALSGVEFNSDLHQPWAQDFLIGLRKQFRGEIAVDVTYMRRNYRDNYALVDVNGIYPSGPNQPFGGFGRVDPNRGIIYQQNNMTWNHAELDILEGSISKNLTNDFQFLFSWNRQWIREGGDYNPTDPARFIEPDKFANNRQLSIGFGNREHNSLSGNNQTQYNAYRPWSTSFSGQYFAPFEIMVGASYMIQAGDYSGILSDRPGVDPIFGPGKITLANGTTQSNPLANPRRFHGANRGDGQIANEVVRYLNATVARTFEAGGGHELEVSVGMFNLLNSGAHSNYSRGSGERYATSYLRVFNRYAPRVFSVGLKYRF
jgi:hypothetical protein